MTGAAGGDGTSQPWVRVALLYRPEPPLGGLVRPDLLSSPDRGLQGSVQLVCAPAGFGKSVFVSQWWEQLAMPTVWLTLDSSVDHSRWLLAYLVAAVRQQFPDALAGSLQMARAATLPSEEAIVVELSNELDELDEPIVVLLDDYHQLAEPRIHSFISNLVRHPPQKVHLVVISREEPPPPFGTLRAHGHLSELRMAELAFTEGEFTEFLGREVPQTLASSQVAALRSPPKGGRPELDWPPRRCAWVVRAMWPSARASSIRPPRTTSWGRPSARLPPTFDDSGDWRSPARAGSSCCAPTGPWSRGSTRPGAQANSRRSTDQEAGRGQQRESMRCRPRPPGNRNLRFGAP